MPRKSTRASCNRRLGVKAIDDATLEIKLNAPTPYFLGQLCHQSALPVHPASVEKYGDDFSKPGNMVSNGAFTLAEFVPNSHVKAVKNPLYRDAANVKIDAVMYYPTEDRGPLCAASRLASWIPTTMLPSSRSISCAKIWVTSSA